MRATGKIPAETRELAVPLAEIAANPDECGYLPEKIEVRLPIEERITLRRLMTALDELNARATTRNGSVVLANSAANAVLWLLQQLREDRGSS